MNETDIKTAEDLLVKLERTDITGISIDSRTIRNGELFVAIRGDRFDGHDFVQDALQKGAWGAVVERSALEQKYVSLGGKQNVFPVEDTLLSLQEMSMRHRRKFTLPLVAITGSNGKTTTKEMAARILREAGPVLRNEGNLNNHIGVPLTLLKMTRDHRAAVIEMGMSAAGEIALLAHLAAPTVGVITNVGPAHLEFLGSMDNVARAKGELLRGMPQQGTAVLNADDDYCGMFRELFGGTVRTFGLDRPADVAGRIAGQGPDHTDIVIAAGGASAPVRLRTVGKHNVRNALAAAAAALAAGLPLGAVQRGLGAFEPVAMRSELRSYGGRTVLADCYNANPASMQAALETIAALRGRGRVIAVLGDMLELGQGSPEQHREVGGAAARLGIDLLITVGPLSTHIAAGAREKGMAADRVIEAGSTAAAAGLLRSLSRSGDVVLVKGSRGMKMESVLEGF